MTRAVLVALAATIALAGTVVGANQLAADSKRASHNDFLALDPNQRESTLREMPVHDRIALKRAHAERWLQQT